VRYIPNQRFYIETDAIIHLAGKAHDLKGFNPSDYYRINFELTKQLFDAFLFRGFCIYIYEYYLRQQQ
jgi:nucleoside-diphosphate-sugar epimerase